MEVLGLPFPDSFWLWAASLSWIPCGSLGLLFWIPCGFWGASGGKVLRERGPGSNASGKKARVKTSAAIDPSNISKKKSFKWMGLLQNTASAQYRAKLASQAK